MSCDYRPHKLPTISFIGGQTQDLSFHVYLCTKDNPVDLDGCEVTFSAVSVLNKTGQPIISKGMSIKQGSPESGDTVEITLTAQDTVQMCGKYIYQITIRDGRGYMQQAQGDIIVFNNINKELVR